MPEEASGPYRTTPTLSGRAISNLFRRPHYFNDIFTQADIIGVGSIPIVILTGFFTGAVLALQSASSLATFGATALTARWYLCPWSRNWVRC